MPANVANVARVTPDLMRSWQIAVRHRVEASGLRTWELVLPGGFRGPQHEHELPFFCVLIDGWMESFYRRSSIAYHRFLNVFHPSGTVHSGQAARDGAIVLTLEMTSVWKPRLEEIGALPRAPAPVSADDGAWIARRLLSELRDPQPCSHLVLEGLTLELLAAAARAPLGGGAAPPWLAGVLDRLHDELDRPVTLCQLATELGIPAARLSALFRRHTGRTLGDYRRELQVQFVRERLRQRRHAGEPLAEIALAAGFADQAHCTRVFKAATGWTPARYRAAALAREVIAPA